MVTVTIIVYCRFVLKIAANNMLKINTEIQQIIKAFKLGAFKASMIINTDVAGHSLAEFKTKQGTFKHYYLNNKN